MSITHVGVIGAGQMGSGIAQVCAIAGLNVTLNDVNDTALNHAVCAIKQSLERMISKDKLSRQDAEEAVNRIKTDTKMSAVSRCDIVIEAATEDETLKLEIFQQLDELCKAKTILASNTSSISITRLAATTQRPSQVIGMHFMNPVPMMALVEVIRGLQTNDSVFSKVAGLAKDIGKTPVDVRDGYGFVANRILLPMINEAIFCRYENMASAEEIDTVMKLGMGHPMGPLALADLIGLDTCLSIMEVMYEGFKDCKYRPCPLLNQMVDAGYLGRKSGRGFYQYESNEGKSWFQPL